MYVDIFGLHLPILFYLSKFLLDSFYICLLLSGYRMAAECARNALLEKVMDNKHDAGTGSDMSLQLLLVYISLIGFALRFHYLLCHIIII